MPLPLKARVAVRDEWEKEDSETQKALRAVKETVGKPVSCRPDFAVLWEGLQTVYQDGGDFVVAITSLIRLWAQELNSLLSDEEHEVWAEQLLESMEDGGARVITLVVEIGKSSAVGTAWIASSATFTLSVPTTKVVFAPHHSAEIKSQLFEAFEKKEAAPPEDWADLGDSKPTGLPIRTGGAAAASSSTFLPTVAEVPRPDILTHEVPYWLFIHERGNFIEVQCSHSPSLELLAAYLQKWCRTTPNRADRLPLMDVQLNKSAFGLGIVYDVLTIAPNDDRAMTRLPPVLLLNIVQNVLGYKLVVEFSQSWRFRRDTPIKPAS